MIISKGIKHSNEHILITKSFFKISEKIKMIVIINIIRVTIIWELININLFANISRNLFTSLNGLLVVNLGKSLYFIQFVIYSKVVLVVW